MEVDAGFLESIHRLVWGGLEEAEAANCCCRILSNLSRKAWDSPSSHYQCNVKGHIVID
jgi:hypothetical protein